MDGDRRNLRIEQERKSQGYSKAGLARRADLNESTVGLVMCGRLRPWPGQLRKLAEALKWTGDPAELLEVVQER